MSHSFLFETGSEAAARAVTAALASRGFVVVRSFDLRSALAASSECGCPHHGTAQCTCQFVVLLAYAQGTPAVVTVHGRDGRTEVQLVCDPSARPTERLAETVTTAIVEALAHIQASSPPLPGSGTR